MTYIGSDITISNKSVLPLIEGGKGISISTGETAGAWAAAGGVGTFSAVNANFSDDNCDPINRKYEGKSRLDRRKHLIKSAIKGGITQAKIAHDISGGNGRIHLNILWEMGASQEILSEILDETKGLVHGVTCGAGMPYKLAEISSSRGVYYYPIVSSSRAFSALYKRSYRKYAEFLGGVVYEDPWVAGGHNGISNAEDKDVPQRPYERVIELRKCMCELGISKNVPIIIAGGVWWLSEWSDYINNPDIGITAFQFGTRPLLVKESPIVNAWYEKLMSLKEGDVKLTQVSPTGFYSSAVNNEFLKNLIALRDREIYINEEGEKEFLINGRAYRISESDLNRAQEFENSGFTAAMLTPGKSIVFTTPQHKAQIQEDQRNCTCCLSCCKFSSWCENEKCTTGEIPDPRTFCIQKTLQNIAHGGNVENNLMFAGHIAYRFATDPFYKDGFIPTIKELVDRICTGY